jgi:hypothetical protein
MKMQKQRRAMAKSKVEEFVRKAEEIYANQLRAILE